MRIRFEKNYILVLAPRFVRFIGQIVMGTPEAKGLAAFPFIFVSKEEFIQPWLIQHELIHFRQSFETLFVGLPILSFMERLYARFILKKDKMDRYLYAAAEQEAYLNMHDPEYLRCRPFGSMFRVTHKRNFKLIGPGQLEFFDTK
jgi:hypothetical protein